jgi:ABC-type lipoprotein release transport system permease subunit
MIIPKLAVRNMLGAGAKTWLNAAVLSMAFVIIIVVQGIYNGLDAEASRTKIEAEYGGGQYWVNGYDPYDPFTLQDAHAPIPDTLQAQIDAGKAAAILLVQGTLYPEGKILPVLLKGLAPAQTILKIPSAVFRPVNHDLPGLIGERMARTSGLKKGDSVTVRWRDAKGTFDARDIQIVGVFSTDDQGVDEGQIWLPLETLRILAAMPGQATIVAAARDSGPAHAVAGWTFQGLDVLLKDVHDLVRGKTIGASLLYAMLLFLAMLAVFNTQLLSIWRRRKEIGTMMALGVPRGRVIGLFTFEGALNSIFAALIGAVYGIPLMAYIAAHGFSMGAKQGDSFGMAIGEKLYPVYGTVLVAGTTVLVFLITTIVSWLPTRKIARLKPTDALRGRMS